MVSEILREHVIKMEFATFFDTTHGLRHAKRSYPFPLREKKKLKFASFKQNIKFAVHIFVADEKRPYHMTIDVLGLHCHGIDK